VCGRSWEVVGTPSCNCCGQRSKYGAFMKNLQALVGRRKIQRAGRHRARNDCPRLVSVTNNDVGFSQAGPTFNKDTALNHQRSSLRS
jgi:hypothetical protein